MLLERRALYNLLRSNWLKDSTLEIKKWQVEDYRAVPNEELWKRLHEAGISIDLEELRLYVRNCENPEELVDCLWLDQKESEEKDQIYLILFELWRRHFPEKKTLSLFCDELDHRIDLYETSGEKDDEYIQEALIELEDILDHHVDQGVDAKEVFSSLVSYCAHDVESFLYNFISEKITEENEIYASELITSFYDYIEDQQWFDFLQARTVAATDLLESHRMFNNLAESLFDQPDLDLLLEMACFMIHKGDAQLFIRIVQQTLSLISVEEEFQELLAISTDFYRCLDQEKQEKLLQEIFAKRADNDPSTPLNLKDKDVRALKGILDSPINLQNQM